MRSWSACGCGRGGCAARGVNSPPRPGTTPVRCPRRGGTWIWPPGGCGSGRTCGGCVARCTGSSPRVCRLATTMDKTALARLVRVDWDTTGRIIERVVADRLDPNRLQHLFQVGVDEVSWRKGHSYLTLVSNHETGKFVWGREGKDAVTLDHFFDDLGADRAEAIQAVSMDMSPAFRKSVSTHAGQAVICYDPFHVVALATAALDKVRRQVWQELRKLPD